MISVVSGMKKASAAVLLLATLVSSLPITQIYAVEKVSKEPEIITAEDGSEWILGTEIAEENETTLSDNSDDVFFDDNIDIIEYTEDNSTPEESSEDEDEPEIDYYEYDLVQYKERAVRAAGDSWKLFTSDHAYGVPPVAGFTTTYNSAYTGIRSSASNSWGTSWGFSKKYVQRVKNGQLTGPKYIAYCMTPEAGATTMGYTESSAARWNSLSTGQKRAIAIILSTGYGGTNTNPSNDYSVAGGWASYTTKAGPSTIDKPEGVSKEKAYQWVEQYAATQLMIWEVICGYRDCSGTYPTFNLVRNMALTSGGSTSSVKNCFASSTASQNRSSFIACYNAIETALRRFNAKPSFSSFGVKPSQRKSDGLRINEYNITPNAARTEWKITIKDENGYLPSFLISIGEKYKELVTKGHVQVNSSGSNLTITFDRTAAQIIAQQDATSCTGGRPHTYNDAGTCTVCKAKKVDETGWVNFKCRQNYFIKCADPAKILSFGTSGNYQDTCSLADVITETVDPKDAYIRLKLLDVDLPELEIAKVDEAGAKIGGASLKLYHGSELVDSWTSVAGQTHKIANTVLFPGDEYRIHEEGTINGYFSAVDMTFILQASTSVQIKNFKNDRIVLKIGKVIGGTSNYLEGARLALYPQGNTTAGKEIYKWTSSSAGPVGIPATLLRAGQSYILRELEAPQGYDIAPDQVITIPVTPPNGNNLIVVTMEDVSASNLEIAKVETGTTAPYIGGAQLQLIYNGSVVETWTSEAGKAHAVSPQNIHNGGAYTIREVTPPQGFHKSADKTFTYHETGTVQTILLEDPKIDLSVLKIDADSKMPLAGAVLELHKVSGGQDTKLLTWTSTTQAKSIPSSLLSPGSYYIAEAQAPSGYALAENTTFAIGNTKPEGPIQIQVENKTASLYIAKINEDNNNSISGANLSLYYNNTLVESWVSTSEPHKVQNENLHVGGTYRVEETSPANGYFPLSAPVEFTFDATSSNPVKIVNVYNKPLELKIRKADGSNHPLAGAMFVLKKLTIANGIVTNAEAIYSWTSTNEATTIPSGLVEYGKTYRLSETKAPEGGYALANDIDFVFSVDSPYYKNGTFEVTCYNHRRIIQIGKRSALTGEMLAGAVFHIETLGGNDVGQPWVSSATEYHIFDANLLIKGYEYYLCEDEAPIGYKIVPLTRFKYTGEDDFTICVYDELDNPTHTSIVKVDQLGNYVDGAKLALFRGSITTLPNNYQNSSSFIEEWITSASTPLHEIDGVLANGQYTLFEVETPDSYVSMNNGIGYQTFTISNNKQIVVKAVDKLVTVPARILKTDENNTAIPDVWLSLYKKEIKNGITTYAYVDGWLTTTSAKEIDLKVGDYIVTESMPPQGRYSIAADPPAPTAVKTFTISMADEGETIQVRCVDKQTKILFNKVNEDGNPISGARLSILDSNGNTVVGPWTSSFEAHEVSGVLNAGQTYYLHEITPPAGYLLAQDVQFTVPFCEPTTPLTVTMTDKEVGRLSITKTDENDNYLLGADFIAEKKVVIDGVESWEEIDSWTTEICQHTGHFQYTSIDGNTHKYSCTICSASTTSSHRWQASYTASSGYVAPTCTQSGKMYYLCSDCGTKSEAVILPKVGHKYNSSGTCIVCSAKTPTPGTTTTVTETIAEKANSSTLKSGDEIIFTYTYNGKTYLITSFSSSSTSATASVREISAISTTGDNPLLPSGYRWEVDGYGSFEISRFSGTAEKCLRGNTTAVYEASSWGDDFYFANGNMYTNTGSKYVAQRTVNASTGAVSVKLVAISSSTDPGSNIANAITAYKIYQKQTTTTTNTHTHTPTVVGAVNATCQHGGHTGNTICNVCGEQITAGSVTAVKNHTDNNNDGHCDYCNALMSDLAIKTLEPSATHYITGIELGIYRISEVSAPNGYALAAPVLIDTTIESLNKDITITDEKTSVSIVKKDKETGKLIFGAHLQLIKVENGSEEILDSWVTSEEDNPHMVYGLLTSSQIATRSSNEVYYLVRETSAPHGYIKAADVSFTVPDTGGTIEVEMEDTPTVIEFDKRDKLGNLLGGAELAVIKQTGIGSNVITEEVDSWNTNSSNPHRVYGIPTQAQIENYVAASKPSYFLVEKTAPSGYWIADAVPIAGASDDLQRVSYVTLENHITEASVEKVDEDGNPLPGATLQLVEITDGITERVLYTWVSTDSPYTITGLATASEAEERGIVYCVRETVAPFGYELDTTDHVISIPDNEPSDPILVQIENEKITEAEVFFEKQDMNGNILSGAVLALYEESVDNPACTAEKHEFYGDICTYCGAERTETLLKQWVSGYSSIEASKCTHKWDDWYDVNHDTSKRQCSVCGMTQTHYCADSCTHEQEESGLFRFTCTECGKTWLGSCNHDWTAWSADGEGHHRRNCRICDEIEVRDCRETCALTEDDGIELECTICGYTWEEDENPKLSYVLPLEEIARAEGKSYILREISAPNGYLLAPEVRFDGAKLFKDKKHTVTIFDEKTELSFEKVSGEDLRLLPGADLEIVEIYANGSERVIDSWNTDESNPHTVTGLYTPTQAYEAGLHYVLREINAPDGYTIAEDIPFVGSPLPSSATTVQMIDDVERVGAELHIRKVDAAGTGVGGVHLQLQRINTSSGASTWDVIDDWWTVCGPGNHISEDGDPYCDRCQMPVDSEKPNEHVLQENVCVPGQYRLVELMPQNGWYMPDNNTVAFNLLDSDIGTTKSVTMINTQKTEYYIQKTDGINGLAGATLAIYGIQTDGTDLLVEQWISTTAPHHISGKIMTVSEAEVLSIDHYELREIEPPHGFIAGDPISFDPLPDQEDTSILGTTINTPLILTNTRDVKTGIETGNIVTACVLIIGGAGFAGLIFFLSRRKKQTSHK